MAGGSPDSQGEEGLLGPRTHGGDVEGSGGNSNRRFTASITYHDFLHGFWAGHGTGTAILKAKLLQQLAALRQDFLYVIFLDLHKAYEALDRYRCL